MAREQSPGESLSYRDAITYIIDRSGYEKGFVANPFDAETVGLRRTAWLLDALGHPEQRYPSIHVAGTKGKGSTAAMIESIARAAGLRVGLYSSPHLHTFRERVQLSGEPIGEALFAELVAELAPRNAQLAAAHPEWGEATAFEVATALALLAFARWRVDLAVVEVGLGGRLDATNVVLPAVSVITPISLDHTRILGDTLAQIATEKGGIIKPGRPVALGPQPAEAAETLRRIAAGRGSPVLEAGRDWQSAGSTERFVLRGPWGEYRDLSVALRGAHQLDNAALAVAAGWLWARDRIGEDAIRRGLAEVVWPGRFELLRAEPTVVVDGAHNVDSAERLAQALSQEYGSRRLWLLLGISADKDIEGMVRTLAPPAWRVVATASHNPRAVGSERIAQAARETRPNDPDFALEAPDVAAALRLVLGRADPDDVICVTGSLYVVAEAREALGVARSDEFERELLYR